jgi:hypothetical protein
VRPFSLAVLVMATATVHGQSDDVAKKVYSSSQNSVFLVYVTIVVVSLRRWEVRSWWHHEH